MFAEIDSVTEILATRTVEPVVEELNLDNQLVGELAVFKFLKYAI